MKRTIFCRNTDRWRRGTWSSASCKSPAQAKPLTYRLEEAAGYIVLNVNENKTDFDFSFSKHEEAISELHGKPLK